MSKEIKKNIDICNQIKKKLKKLTSSNRPDIYILIDELQTKIEWLKELYKQII